MAKGRHITIDASIDKNLWPNEAELEEYLIKAAKVGGATPLDSCVIKLPCQKSRDSSPPGGTAWVGLDESHITCHYFVEEDKVVFALDVFTCGDHANPSVIVHTIKAQLGMERETSDYVQTEFERMCI